MLDLRRLILLRELSSRGTIAAVAAALHMTGPAVSQQLAVLEREAGCRLLVRQGRRVALTDAGRLLVAHADVMLTDMARAEADLEVARQGALGSITVAAFPSAARELLPAVWAECAGGDPRLALQIREAEPDLGIRWLSERHVDIAVSHEYNLMPRRVSAYSAERLFEEPVLLALSPAEAARRQLRPGIPAKLGDFADSDWLVPGPDVACHEMVQRACGAAGFVARTTVHATDFTVLAALAAAGAGVALLPRMAVPPGADLALFPLASPVTRQVSVLVRAGEGGKPAIARFTAALHAAVRARLPAVEDQPAACPPA